MKRPAPKRVPFAVKRPPAAAEAVGAEATGDNPMVKTRRRQQRSALTRQNIIATATNEFANSGYAGATTRAIAAAAAVDHGLITHHFGGKAGLWRAVIEEPRRRLREQAEAAITTTDPDDDTVLAKLMEAYIRFIASNPEFAAIMSHARTHESADAELMLQDSSTMHDLFAKVIADAQRRGHCVEGIPSHIYFAIVAVTTRVFVVPLEVAKFVGMSPYSEKFIQRHLELCQKLFLRGTWDSKLSPRDRRTPTKRS